MFRFVVIALAGLTLVVWAGAVAKMDSDPLGEISEASDYWRSWMAWHWSGKDAVVSTLRDPGSAEFRNLTHRRSQGGLSVTCGEVNARNALGGYVGYRPFITAGKPDLTYISDGTVGDFQEVWRRLCT